MNIKENLENLPPLPNQPLEQLPQTVLEKRLEQPEVKKEVEKTINQPIVEPLVQSTTQVSVGAPKDPLEVEIEGLLEDGLGEAYLKLSPDKKQEFKTVGEQTAKKITVLLREARVKIDKIFLLIVRWLKIIPGVNKFFLEQEAKIKTDRLIKLNKVE